MLFGIVGTVSPLSQNQAIVIVVTVFPLLTHPGIQMSRYSELLLQDLNKKDKQPESEKRTPVNPFNILQLSGNVFNYQRFSEKKPQKITRYYQFDKFQLSLSDISVLISLNLSFSLISAYKGYTTEGHDISCPCCLIMRECPCKSPIRASIYLITIFFASEKSPAIIR